MQTLEMKKTDLGRVVLPNETIKKMRKIATLERKTGAQFVLHAVEKEMDLAARRIRRKQAKGHNDLLP